MKAAWSEFFPLKSIDDNWNSTSAKPGVYVVKSGRSIPRLGGEDINGILYIGKSLVARNRLWNFWYEHHPASGMLWQYPKKLASRIFDCPCNSSKDVDELVGDLLVRIATPIPKRTLSEAERAVLFEYFDMFCELPPLNFSFPDRWGKEPSSELREWAKQGVA